MEIDAVAMVRTDRLEAVQIPFAPDARRVCSTTAMTAPMAWSDSEFAGPRGFEGGVKLDTASEVDGLVVGRDASSAGQPIAVMRFAPRNTGARLVAPGPGNDRIGTPLGVTEKRQVQ
jgi:hypothetical protein